MVPRRMFCKVPLFPNIFQIQHIQMSIAMIETRGIIVISHRKLLFRTVKLRPIAAVRTIFHFDDAHAYDNQ